MVQGSGQMGELLGRRHRRRRRRHLEIHVDIQARKLYLEFFIWFWGRGERYLRMETRVNTEFRYKSYEHSGLAWEAIFKKVLVLTLIPRLPCSFFREHVPKIDSFPKCPQTAGSF